MGRLEELKLKNICQKEGRMKEYEYYRICKESIKRNIDMYQKYVEDPTKINEISRWKQALEETKLKLKFVRPNKKEDIAYRQNQLNDNKFVNELQSVVPSDLDLRFHGTPIYFAEQIIRNGEITSTADRYDGYMKSTDMNGEISASTIKTLPRTLDFFSDMEAHQRSMPAGCIFVLLPKDKDDATFGIDLLHSVNFKKNPEQLFGIFTTPENIERVKEWMNESGLDSNLVNTFEGFLDVVKGNKYLFDIEDVKDMAMEEGKHARRAGNIVKLYSKLKETIRSIKGKILNKEGEKDGTSRD